MQIQFLSDTHGYNYFNISSEADVVVHGGDADDGPECLLEFIKQCKELNKPPIITPGNHDYWHHNIEDVIELLRSCGGYVLDDQNNFELNGYTFVGGTLFSNFRQNTKDSWVVDQYREACSRLGDFYKIYSQDDSVTPEVYTTLFNKTLNNINKFRHKDNVIVVSHFPPKPLCASPLFDAESNISAYFTNDIDLSGFKTWLFGHTHYNIDQVVQGCRLISNALGYPHELSGNPFQNSLLIEV